MHLYIVRLTNEGQAYLSCRHKPAAPLQARARRNRSLDPPVPGISGLLRDPRRPSSTVLQRFAPAIPGQGSPIGLRDTDRKEIEGQELCLSRPRHGLEVLER